MAIKEMPLEEKYEMLFDGYLMEAAKNYALQKELGVVDKYIDLTVKVAKKRIPSVLGIAFKVMKAIAPGKAFKKVTDQFAYTMQIFHPLSDIELTLVSNREATIRIKDCSVLKRMRDLVKKAGLDVDPKFHCEMDTKLAPEVLKEFGLDVTWELEENGCIMRTKLK